MIRFAKKEDFSQIIDIWNKSFNEDKNFTKWFFNKIYEPENAIVFEKNGTICSMLQRLPYEINNIGKATYIFGACTLPEYRGKGLMAKLIYFSEELDKQKEIQASILIPQEKSLFKYYERFGYSPKFKIKSGIIKKQNEMVHPYSFSVCLEDDIDMLSHLYNSFLQDTNYVLRNKDYWLTQFEMFHKFDGNVFCLKNDEDIVGYAFVWNDKDVIVQEIFGLNNDVKKILCNDIMHFYRVNKLKTFSLSKNSIYDDFGCIKLYNKLENTLPFIMNLMFN